MRVEIVIERQEESLGMPRKQNVKGNDREHDRENENPEIEAVI